ncbi:MAG: hypothetical protein IJF67_11685 [Clostridia bacterium]|nr:hypothetical protein [Clostridia bacterium]
MRAQKVSSSRMAFADARRRWRSMAAAVILPPVARHREAAALEKAFAMGRRTFCARKLPIRAAMRRSIFAARMVILPTAAR